MARTVFTTTVSLPKTMAATMKTMCREEGRTTSELVREALRFYERARRHGSAKVSWTDLKARLTRVGKTGVATNLSEFIIRDRAAH